MLKTSVQIAMTCLALIAGMTMAGAFVLKPAGGGPARRWGLPAADNAQRTHAIRYALAADGCTATNTAAELNALRAAFNQWQAITGTCLKFEDAGLVAPPADIRTDDGTNTIYWEKKNLLVNGGRDYLGGRTGYTLVREDADTHAILEADIVFNAVERQWTTDCATSAKAADRTCVGAVALHEIGHFIGLEHSPLGGATMFFRSASGDRLQGGLSADDVAGARSLYPAHTESFGAIAGRVLKDNRPVFGAAVFAHNAAGGAVAGTVTGPRGNFVMSMLPPGDYEVHAAPLDPLGPNRLCAGTDIAPGFSHADTRFLPATVQPVQVAAGKTNRADFTVAAGVPPFRITNIRVPTVDTGDCSWSSLPAQLRAGQSNFTIGVASASLPGGGATLAITGDGLTLGPETFLTNAFGSGLNFISSTVGVARNATPGLRTFVVRQGTNVARANGFLEILPAR